MAKSKRPGRQRHNRRNVRGRIITLFATVGVLAQFAWPARYSYENAPHEGVPDEATAASDNATALLFLIVGSIGSALLLCAILLYVPEGIRRARQAYRDNQEFKDRFR